MLIAPVFSDLIERARRFVQGEEPLDSLQQACLAAASFNREGAHMLDGLSAGILRTETTEELLRQCRAELSAQLQAIDKIRTAAPDGRHRAIEDATAEVRSTSERLSTLSGQLAAEEAKEKTYAPIREVDHFIKTGINVLNGYLAPVEVEARMSRIFGLVQAFHADVERFATLYGRPDLVEPARAEIARLEAALGAATVWLREPSRESLEDCLKLLGGGVTELTRHLQAFDEVARQAPYPHLAEIALARERGAHQLLPELWARVEQAFYHQERELMAARELAFFPLFQVEWRRANAALGELGATMSEVGPRYVADPVGTDVSPVQAGFEKLTGEIEQVWRKLEAEVARWSEAPQFQRLRELVLRAGAGKLGRSQLGEIVSHYQELQAELAEQVAGTELSELLDRQAIAFEQMQQWVEGGDVSLLEAGWAELEATLPRLLELHREMRSQAGVSDKPKVAVSCFRCGAENPPGQAHCVRCKAVLPAASEAPPDYTDIIGGAPAPEAVGANIARLERLVEEVEAGRSGPAEVAREVDRMLEQAYAIKRQFEATVIPLTGSDATLDAYARFFAERMQQFLEGLTTMRAYAGEAGLASLRYGLAAVQSSGAELQVFRSTIERAMRGG